MIDPMTIELPVLGLFIKFMIASTCLLGLVWLLEKTRIVSTPDMSELAWKLAIAASFLALLPVSLSPASIILPVYDTLQTEHSGTPSSGPRAAQATTEHNILSTGYNQITATGSDSETTHPVLVPEPPVPARVSPEINAALTASRSVSDVDQTPSDISTGLKKKTGYSVSTLFFAGWSILTAVALLALVISFQRAIRNLGKRTRVPSEHSANIALRAVCEKAGIRHVPFLSRSDAINSPVCLPGREICLPSWAFDDMKEDALHSLIAHELAHMLRRDPFQIIFLQTLCRLCFFQPLFVVARKRLEDCAELAADEWAANQLASANSVAEALYTCAQKITQKRQIQWGLAMAGDKSILRQRVERLIKAEKSKFDGASTMKRCTVSLVLAGVVLAVPGIEFAAAMNAGVPEDTFAAGASSDRIDENSVVHDEPRSFKLDKPQTSGSNRKSHTHISGDDQGFETGNMMWVDGSRAIKVSWEGVFRLSDDERAITSISDGGHLDIETTVNDRKKRARFDSKNGNLEITYWDQGREQPFAEDTATWFAETLQLLLQHTAIDMKNRVARYLKQGGTDDALDRMADIRSDYVKRMFTIELIRQADFSDTQFKALLRNIRSLESDYEVRLTLAELLHAGILTPGTLEDVLAIAKKIESDYEKRLTLSPMLKHFTFDDKSMNTLLTLTQSIESDYELRLLLSDAVEQNFSGANAEKLIKALHAIESDYELRLVVEQIAATQTLTDGLDTHLVAAVKTIEGDYERRLALSAIIGSSSLSEQAWLTAIKHANAMNSDYEKRLILGEIGDHMPDTDDLRTAWAKAVQSINSDHERRLLTGADR